jgi:hypothetical protein
MGDSKIDNWLHKFRIPLIILLIIFVSITTLFLLIYYKCVCVKAEWVKDLLLHLMSEIIGIILVIILIDRIIENIQEKQRKKRQLIAFKQLRIPLDHQFNLLLNIFKASVQEKPNKVYVNVSDVFDDTFYKEIEYFDFSKSAPIVQQIDWFKYLEIEFIRFRDSLNRTLEKYSLFLDSDVNDCIEELINSNMMSFILIVPSLKEIYIKRGYHHTYNLLSGAMVQTVKEYIDLFLKLIDYYNQNVQDRDQIKCGKNLWRNDVAPKIGSSRINPDNPS